VRLDALGDAQLGATRARIARKLVIARGHRVTSQDAQPGRAPADAGGHLRRADAAALLGLEETLDDAILQRVEADDGDASTRRQQRQR
jgi:hypothetical protein